MSNRAYPTNDAHPESAPMHLPMHGRDYSVPTALPHQYLSRMHRTAAKEQRAEDTIETQQRRFVSDAARFSQESQCDGAACAGKYVPAGNERLRQVYAKNELYTDVTSPENAQPAQPLAETAYQRRFQTINPRLPCLDRRAQLQEDAAERRALADDYGSNAAMLRQAAARSGNHSVNAARAEKTKYEETYKKGNEDAYAHVEALQKSVRGYEDTSASTLNKVKQWNQREAGRRAFFGAY